MLAAAGGMWQSKYWAVLGFEALLAVALLVFALLLLKASSVLGVIIPLRGPRPRRLALLQAHPLHGPHPDAPPVTDWPFAYVDRVRFGDLDAMRHLNNVAFLGFFESARIAFMAEVIPEHGPRAPDDFGLIFAECHITYRSPAFFDEEIRTQIRPGRGAPLLVPPGLRDALASATGACSPRAGARSWATTTPRAARRRCPTA